MKQILEVDEIVSGAVNYSELSGKYIVIKIKAGMRGVDWEKAFTALNMMAEQGWSYRDFLAAGSLGGYLMERK